MNELIKVSEHNGGQAVNARDLHNFLEVKTHFKDWIKRRIEDYGFTEKQDFEVSLIFEQNSKGGRPTKEYIITMDMAKELSMIERTDKGKQARQYFIECEKRLKEQTVFTPLIPCEDSEYFHINITEHRKIYHQNFIKEAKCFLYKGDLMKISKENNLSYNKVRRVMSCVLFDYNIIERIYEKAMQNKYSLEIGMTNMISSLRC